MVYLRIFICGSKHDSHLITNQSKDFLLVYGSVPNGLGHLQLFPTWVFLWYKFSLIFDRLISFWRIYTLEIDTIKTHIKFTSMLQRPLVIWGIGYPLSHTLSCLICQPSYEAFIAIIGAHIVLYILVFASVLMSSSCKLQFVRFMVAFPLCCDIFLTVLPSTQYDLYITLAALLGWYMGGNYYWSRS